GDDAIGEIVGELDQQRQFLRAQSGCFARIYDQHAEYFRPILERQGEARQIAPLSGGGAPGTHGRISDEIIIELRDAGADRPPGRALAMRVILRPAETGCGKEARFVPGMGDGPDGLGLIVLDRADEGHAVAAKFDDDLAHDIEEVFLVIGANQRLIAFAQNPEDSSKPQIFLLGLPTLSGVQETGDKESFLSGAHNVKLTLQMQSLAVDAGKFKFECVGRKSFAGSKPPQGFGKAGSQGLWKAAFGRDASQQFG